MFRDASSNAFDWLISYAKHSRSTAVYVLYKITILYWQYKEEYKPYLICIMIVYILTKALCYGNFILPGILKLNKLLDRENTPHLDVQVVATDNVDPKLTSTATVNIIVQDINDNTPEFSPYLISYTVMEDAIVDTPVATIDATDKDLGEFGNIIYRFDVSNDDSKLTVNHSTVSL